MKRREVIEADLTWMGGRLERGVRIVVEDGRILSTGASNLEPTRRLRGQALLPGMISAHSHAFQRALRGRGELFPAGEGSFWSWREAMYELVPQLDEQRFHDIVRTTFDEMLSAGITTVGEFHYLHHSASARDYAFDEIVLRAAREAGIRIVLLMTCYRTGSIGGPLSPAQKRFETASVEELWTQIDALVPKLDPATQTVGVAAHSIRAVPLEDIAPLHAEARRRGMPMHMHVEEQRREIEECRASYGATPLELINDRLESCEAFTAVHATHSSAAALQRFLARGGSVCITPLTEANLGDGVPEAGPFLPYSDRISLGTDSNARISMIEEMRWLEYAQRLGSETRGVFRDDRGRSAARLFEFATLGGAHSLGVDAGRIEEGSSADFIAVDLAVAEVEDALLDAIVFGSGDEVIRATCVAGKWRS